MNEQKLFNKAYAGLAKQGFQRSSNPGNGCLYRGPNGFKCAIGHAIPDSKYKKSMDSQSLGSEPRLRRVLRAIGYRGDFYLADELQGVHDFGSEPAIMQKNMRAFAKRHGLRVPQLESES